MFALTVLLLAQTAAEPAGDIVVRGRRSGEALEACVARGCATPDDTRLSLAHAEALFAQGDYHAARRALDAALSRQKREAARFPRHVAALHEASATVNRHLGDMDAYRSQTIAQVRTLRANLPPDDPQVLLMAVQLGDYWLSRRHMQEARRQFEAAARDYERRGQGRLAALCRLRIASVDIARENFAAVEGNLRSIAESAASQDPTVRQFTAVLRARLAAARGEDADVEALIAALRSAPAAAPVLIQPGPSPTDAEAASTRAVAASGDLRNAVVPFSSEVVPVRWVDIGFLIVPDGRVVDVELLRGSRSAGWSDPYRAEIAGRRYAPIAVPPGEPGMYRVERYTLRADRVVPSGSLIKRPTGTARVEVLDLTQDVVGAARAS